MVQIRSAIFLFATLASSFATPLRRSVASIEAEIATINTQVTTLDTSINAFPATGGTLANALSIHTQAVALTSTLTTAATDVTNTGALAEADARTILTSVEVIQPIIIDALKQIVVKKPAFAALPIGGLVALIRADLANLSAQTTLFENGLIGNAPADLQTEATNVKTAIDAAFATAIAAYAA